MSGKVLKISSDLNILMDEPEEADLKKRNEVLLKDLETIQKSLQEFEESIQKVEKNIENIEEEAKKRTESLKDQIKMLDLKLKSDEMMRFLKIVEVNPKKGEGDSQILL